MAGRATPVRRYTIGTHGSPWTPERARERAIELLFKKHIGVDPIEEERAKWTAAVVEERLLLKNYYLTFMEFHVEAKDLRTAGATKRIFEADILPVFGERSIASITRKELNEHFTELKKRAKSAANKAFSQMRALLNYAKKQEDIEKSPMEGMEKPHQFDPRKRTLWDWELQRVWEAAHDLGGLEGIVILFLLLTGQRLNEVAGMSWEEIRTEDWVWVIPPERTKNKREHVVPLPETMIALLNSHWPPERRKGLMFTRSGTRPITTFSTAKKAFDAYVERRMQLARARAGADRERTMAPFTFHDLRRTLATGLQRLDIPREHIEALLNHVSGSSKLIDTYQTYKYEQEAGRALTVWARHLSALTKREDAWPGGRDLPKLPVSATRTRKESTKVERKA